MTKLERSIHNRKCWKLACIRTIATHNVTNAARVAARVCNHCNSSCSNERDIRVLTETVAKGKRELSTMKDCIAVVRYGPPKISDLLVRHLSASGEVVLSPTPLLQRVREKRLELFGHRHHVNKVARKDKGCLK